ncbi:hypothetical protein ABGT15_12255 [Flavobacterium enshiense]|uniref:hypothetical protein n=1 Tax=Flavobacterium enshiense TaxID=1341165 RepID=UPI00345CED21
MAFQAKENVIRSVTLLYFSVIGLYSIFVFFEYNPLKEVFGFIRIPILMLLYYYASLKRDYLYFLALLLFQIAYLSFSQSSESSYFWGAVTSVVFRFVLIVIVCRVLKDMRWTTIFLTSLPILFVFLYLIDLIKESITNSYYLWVINGFLTAFLGGLSVSNYCYKDDKKSFWLLISALLFVVQIGLFFVNKFYLKQQLFVHMIILLYGVSHYTFFKFMVFKDEESVEQG